MSVTLCGQLNNDNTGPIGCDIQREAPLLMLIGSPVFDTDDYADADTFEDALIAATKLSRSAGDKLFVLPFIQGVTNSTVAATNGTLGYGLTFRLVDARPTYTFDILAGSTLEKSLKKYDGKSVPMFIYDKGQTTWGIADKDGDFSAPYWQFSLDARPFQDGQNVTVTKVTISLVNTDDWVANAAGINAPLNTASLKGLNDVIIEKVSNVANVYQYRLYVASSELISTRQRKLNMATQFGATLASASLWLAKTGATFGTTLTIDSVALNGDLYTVTYNSTAYSALASLAKIKQDLVSPTALDAANVTGIEAIPVIVVK